jgi:hypothetical protein
MSDVQAAMGRVVARFCDVVCTRYAIEEEQIVKENAPWTDRTGDARKLLKGEVIDKKGAIGIQLLHRVEYRKALETANDGNYAILKPTIEGLRAKFFETVREIFGGKK